MRTAPHTAQVLDGTFRPWESGYPETTRTYDPGKHRFTRVSDVLAEAVRSFPDREAFSLVLPSGDTLDKTYRDIDAASNAIACYLREECGLKQGDVVAIQLPNSIHYPIVLFGAMKAGLVVTNVNPLYTPREIAYQLVDANAKVLFCFNMFAERLSNVLNETPVTKIVNCAAWEMFPAINRTKLKFFMTTVKKLVPPLEVAHDTFAAALKQGARHKKTYDLSSIEPSSVAFLQYTGGTTGVSKGAKLTHHNFASVLSMIECGMGDDIQSDTQMTILTVIPFYHIFALVMNMMLFMAHGGRNVLIANLNPISNLRPAIEKYKIDWVTGVDTLFNGLMAEPWFQENPPQMKLALAGGTSLRPDTAKRWRDMVGPIIEGYGMTESTCIVAFTPLSGDGKPGSVGLPVPGMDIRVCDDNGNPVELNVPGELEIRGSNVTEGYHNAAGGDSAVTQEGWMATGDVVVVDEDGFMSIVDRKKDVIIVSGFNVYPNELEAVIQDIAGVTEVAVIGKPHDQRGESPVAFVKSASDSVTSEIIIQHCRNNLTGYKVPTEVHFVEDLPKTPVGKILRKELRTA